MEKGEARQASPFSYKIERKRRREVEDEETPPLIKVSLYTRRDRECS